MTLLATMVIQAVEVVEYVNNHFKSGFFIDHI